MKKKYKKNTEELDEEENLFGYNDDYSFIVGYTGGGVPYGLTWREIGIDQDLSLDEKLRLLDEQHCNDNKPNNLIDDFLDEDLPF